LNWSQGTKFVWAFPVIDGMKKMMGTSKKKKKKIAAGVSA